MKKIYLLLPRKDMIVTMMNRGFIIRSPIFMYGSQGKVIKK